MRNERQMIFWFAAAAVFLALIWLLQDILLPFVAGMTIAYFVNPFADFLERSGLPRIAASILIVATATLFIVLLFVFLIPILIAQTQQFVADLPTQVASLRVAVEAWARASLGPNFQTFQDALDQAAAGLSDNWASVAAFAAESVWTRGLAIFNFLSLMLITPLVVFYLLVDWNTMLARVDSWLPREHAPKIRALFSDINDAVSAFIRGQGTVCVILGAVYAIGLSLIGLQYGLLVGLATGVMSFVPFVGWALGTITATTLAVIQFWPDMLPIALVVSVFVFGQVLDAGFLAPKIVGSKIGLHPVWLIFSLIAFSYLFGFVGVLVAVPTAAAIGVMVRYAIGGYLNSGVYAGSGGVADAPAPVDRKSR